MRSSPAARKPDAQFAFLNIPFDKPFEPLYLAFIAGLSGFGLIPQAVLQIPGSKRRLDRLTELMAICQYSFHDISRVELDEKRPCLPRFNMPFELGAAVGMAEHSGHDHFWYAFDAKQYRAQKSLSDLNGTEIYIHERKGQRCSSLPDECPRAEPAPADCPRIAGYLSRRQKSCSDHPTGSGGSFTLRYAAFSGPCHRGKYECATPYRFTSEFQRLLVIPGQGRSFTHIGARQPDRPASLSVTVGRRQAVRSPKTKATRRQTRCRRRC